MSVQAITWVLEDAPDLPAHLVGTLLALANHADRDGRGAYPAQSVVAWYTRKAERNARKDVDTLVKLGLIREGDQRLAAHIRGDRRPVVYDLAMERRREPLRPDGGMHTSPRKGSAGGSQHPPVDAARGDAHVRPDAGVPSQNGHGGTPTSPREMDIAGTGGCLHPPNLKKKKKTSSSSPSPVTQIAAALSLDEEEARGIYNRIASDPNVKAPSRYIDALIASGDIAKFRTSTKPAARAAATHPYQDTGRGYCAKCHMPETHARHGGKP